jgi:lysophospholipid acyltransferase (LPLAT)-like uncharacterized protein
MLKEFWRYTVLPFLIANPGRWIIWLILKSCRVTIEGGEKFSEALKSGHPCILALWHNRIVLMEYTLLRHGCPNRKYLAVISNSRDGRLIERATKKYPQGGVVRIPHNKRSQGLRTMVERLRRGDVLMLTPDGPRGPKYQAKPGIVYAAKQSEATIVPLCWKADRYWQFSSWDSFMIPKPFSKVDVTIGDLITSDCHAELNLEQTAALINERLSVN